MTMVKLDDRLISVFCQVFGAQYRDQVGPATSMDDIPEWDSASFLDLVLSIEDEFGVTFTPDESVQMFQLGHIQRLIDAVVLDIPHDDVAHACCLLHELREAPRDQFNVLVLSGSSTREGLLPAPEAESMLQNRLGRSAGWFNLSVSGLVPAETMQLLEVAGSAWSGVTVFGTSPIILCGCGEAEFVRAATFARFPFHAPVMSEILARRGYAPKAGERNVTMSLELWIERYLKGRDLAEFRYEPYLYPTLAPWPPEKFESREDLLRFYNQSVLNYEESQRINAELYEAIADWHERAGIPIVLVELTLQGRAVAQLDDVGNLTPRYHEFMGEFVRRRNLPYIDAPSIAGITDADFRDPAHIFRKREAYTQAIIDGVASAVAPKSTTAIGPGQG